MSQPDGVSRRGMLATLGIVLNDRCGRNSGGAHRALSALPGDSRGYVGGRVMALARRSRSVSCRRDAPCDVSKSDHVSIGRRDREHPLLGASRGWRQIPGVCHQLRAFGLPGPLVSAIRPVHVSRATGACTIEDGSRASGPPERGLFEYPYKVEQGMLSIKAGRLPTPGSPTASLTNITPTKNTVRLTLKKIGDWLDARVQLAAPVKETMEHPRPTRNSKLVLRFWKRRSDRLCASGCHRHSPCA